MDEGLVLWPFLEQGSPAQTTCLKERYQGWPPEAYSRCQIEPVTYVWLESLDSVGYDTSPELSLFRAVSSEHLRGWCSKATVCRRRLQSTGCFCSLLSWREKAPRTTLSKTPVTIRALDGKERNCHGRSYTYQQSAQLSLQQRCHSELYRRKASCLCPPEGPIPGCLGLFKAPLTQPVTRPHIMTSRESSAVLRRAELFLGPTEDTQGTYAGPCGCLSLFG